MTSEELRALAERLVYHSVLRRDLPDPEQRQLSADLRMTADYLRECADAEPVGYATANGLRMLQQDDATVLLYKHDYLIRPDHVPLYTRPAPAAPQAEPKREPTCLWSRADDDPIAPALADWCGRVRDAVRQIGGDPAEPRDDSDRDIHDGSET